MAYTTIKKPSDYFNTKLYSGTGSSQAVTGVGFQPDWIWFKCRTQAQNHNLFDAIRGSNKIIQSSTANAEATSTALLTSFDSDGFTVNTDGGTNGSGQTYASWNWLANGTGSANTDGSISSTVSANTTSGFSIVSYTGTGANATVGHGLGVAPKMVIVKNRSSVYDWVVWQASFAGTEYMVLNKTDAKGTATAVWNSTIPTSTVFSLGSNAAVNESSATQIAYCFAEKTGYSKFGSYTGNGNADGTFVYTGFKPAFIMIKRTDTTGNWTMFDNKRDGFNCDQAQLKPNTSDAEDAGSASTFLDILSNGFKCRNTASDKNASGGTYIYMAFAEAPLVGDNPATAR
jgi:hypothetical protein